MTLVGKGQHYTYGQLEELWIRNGGTRATAPIAAAIGMAESQGWSNNVNERDTNGAGSYGIWQINNGTTFSSQGPNYGGPPGWNNPNTNARMAVAKWKGAGMGWSPWGTYKTGAYKAYLRGNVPPSTGGLPPPTLTSSPVNGKGGGKLGGPQQQSLGFWGDLKIAAGAIGIDPFGFAASGVSSAISTAIEQGIVNILKDIWTPIFKRAFWLGEMLLGIFIVILAAVALSWIGFAKLEGGNKRAIGSLIAAPETGGMSLLVGAATAQRKTSAQKREERQGVSTEQAQSRIDIAQRRVAVQESQEKRRVANAQQAPAQPTNPDLDNSIERARERARKIREARRKRQ